MTEVVHDPYVPIRKMVMGSGARHPLSELLRLGRIRDIESEILFLGLLNRTVLQILSEKQVCTLEEVAERMKSIDMVDGKADHALDPRKIAEEMGFELPERDAKKEFAERLKSQKRP